MNNEHLEEIKNIIKNSDYKNHYKLQDYFEVEYIDELVQYVEQLEKENKKLKEDNAFLKNNLSKLSKKYIKNDLLNILNKGSDKE